MNLQNKRSGFFPLAWEMAGIALLVLLLSTPTRAQLPELTYVGLPAEPLIGETFCAQVAFQNTSPTVGFGPYYVATTPPEVVVVSGVTYLGLDVPVEDLGVIPASGTITDPISGLPITGEPGGNAFLVRLPVGSVTQGQPLIVVDVCGQVQVGATIDQPLFVNFLPGFEFGDTPTGENGATTGLSVDSETITPRLARIRKDATVREGERPPGPSHAFDYRFVVDISDGEQIRAFRLRDDLPGEIQWTGAAIGLQAPGGVLCAVTESPNAPTMPGGSLEVTCASITGSASTEDLVVTLPVYITDVLNEGPGAPDRLPIENTVDISYLYNGNLSQASDTETVTAVHVEVWKTAAPDSAVPGDTLTFTVNFNVTDYSAGEGLAQLILDDELADGLVFNDDSALSINGTAVPITPQVINDNPGPGLTTITWDVAGAFGGVLPVGARGLLSYSADVRQTYANGTPVVAGDPLGNDVSGGFEHTEGAEDSNDSSSGVGLEDTRSDKILQAPNPPPASFQPGDRITFRLRMDIDAGSAFDVGFTDFLPLPVIFVNDIDLATDIVVPGPPFLQLTPTVTRDVAANSLNFEWGDINETGPVSIAVDVTATVTTQAFADGLFLTNLLTTRSTNSEGAVNNESHALGLRVGAPELTITKGVLSVDNPGAVLTPPAPGNPASELADSDATGVDAGDVVTYLVTIENLGSKAAYNITVNDPAVPGLSCQNLAAGDVRNASGQSLAFTGDSLQTGIVVDGPLSGNDTVPPGGGAPFTGDTLLITQRCIVQTAVVLGSTLVNEARVTYTSTPQAVNFFPERRDDASITLATPTIAKSVTAITPGYAGRLDRVHIGELVRYRVEVTLPEGTLPNVEFSDVVDRGLALVALENVTFSPGVNSSEPPFQPGTVDPVIRNVGGGTQNLDRELLIAPGGPGDLNFGDVVNGNTNNGVAETVVLEYLAVVINWSGNQRGNNRNNRARWSFAGPTGRITAEGSARNVRIIEPGIELTKTFDPSSTDQGAPTTIGIRVRHTGPSDAEAFQLDIRDLIPAGLDVDPASLVRTSCNLAPDVESLSMVRFQAGWVRFPPGSDCSFEFTADVRFFETAGSIITNCVDADWQSISVNDLPLPPPPNSPLGVPRTGDDSDPGGTANSYNARQCANLKVFDVTATKAATDSNQVHTSAVGGTEQLAIGEEVTFDLLVTFPEAPAIELILTDELPYGSLVLELLDWEVLPLPPDTHLSNLQLPPVSSEEDRFNGDGIVDTVVLDFGDQIRNEPADGIVDSRDRLAVRVRARVKDNAQNVNLNEDNNIVRIQFGQGLAGVDQATVQVVEPFIDLSKRGTTSSVEAGDVVTYTLTLEHRVDSRADAFDLTLREALPPELLLVGGSTRLVNCPTPPDVGPLEINNGIEADWVNFPLGARCTIEFDATVSVQAIAGSTIRNEAESAWTSLDNTVSLVDERIYEDRSSWTITVGDPGLEKSLVSTSIAQTPDNQVTMGETLTFELVAIFPDGTTLDTIVEDQLPFIDARLRLLDSRILSVGGDIQIENGQGPGSPGIDCQPDCSTGNNGYDDLAVWNLGRVINDPLRIDLPNSVNGQISFSVTAVVVDDPANQGRPLGLDEYVNLGTLTALNEQRTALAPFILVEPRLALEHTDMLGNDTVPVEAGDEVPVRLTINHVATSSSSAFDVEVRYVLDPSVQLPAGFSVDSTCSILTTDTSTPGEILLSFPELSLAQSSCTIEFPVVMDPALVVPGNYRDTSVLRWESAPGAPDESRTGNATGDLVYVAGVENRLLKEVVGTSSEFTGSGQLDPDVPDLTIGERAGFLVSAVLDEGTIDDVEIIDSLPNGGADGALIIRDASVVQVGSNITTEFDGSPVFDLAANEVSFSFGEVRNFADGVSDLNDRISVLIIAEVVDVADNPPTPASIENLAELRFLGGNVVASAAVDIVQPGLVLTKRFGTPRDGRVDVILELSNPGDGPVFDASVTDVFSEVAPANWQPASMVPVSVPTGWELLQNSAGGATTVTLQVRPGVVPTPNQVLLPGDSVSATFTMTLQDPPEETTILNVANATGFSLPGSEPEAREVSDSGQDTLLLPNLAVTKTWTAGGATVRPGDRVTYEIALVNTGDAPVTRVEVLDTPDPLGLFQAGSVVASQGGTIFQGNQPGSTSVAVIFESIAAGATSTVRYDVLIPTPYPAATVQQLVNQALVISAEVPDRLSDDPAVGGDADPTVVPIAADPAMSVTKNALAGVVNAGGTVFYQIDYGNVGNQDATGVQLFETVPDTNTGSGQVFFNAAASSPGWSCADASPPGTLCTFDVGDLGGGAGGQLIFAVTLEDPLDAGVTSVSNTVIISDDGSNTDPGNCQPDCERTDSDTENTPVLAAPVLELVKDDGIVSAVPGQLVVYRLRVSNVGTQDATGLVLTDTVGDFVTFDAAVSTPGWSCATGAPTGSICEISGDSLLAGETVEVDFAVRVLPTLPAGATVSLNVATVTDDGTNSDNGAPVLARATHETPLLAQPDLVIDKSDGDVIGQPGLIFPYTLTYQNVGNQNATGVVLTETVPTGATFSAVASLPDTWSCADGAPAGSVCTLLLGSVPVGASGSARFGIRVDDPVPPGQASLINTARVDDDGANGADPTPDNNQATEETLVILFPPVGRKSAEALGGVRTEWTMVWFNNANQRDLPVLIIDPIPANSQYLDGTLVCEADGVSTCTSAIFNAAENRIEVRGLIAPDFGAPIFAPRDSLANELLIRFTTFANANQAGIMNRAEGCWDENNSGSPDDDIAQGQQCIPVRASTRVNFPTPIPGLSSEGRLALVLLLLIIAAGALRRRAAPSAEGGV